MKRKSTFLTNNPTKRRRPARTAPDELANASTESGLEFKDTKTIREQAVPYRLATAKFPIAALTSSWNIGINRTVNPKHVEKLCRIFADQGLRRKSVENHLLVACTRSEVEKMKDFLQTSGGGAEVVSAEEEWPSFDNWLTVNGTKAELIAGQHRVEALKLFLRRTGADQDHTSNGKSWWVCEIYDKDAMPHQLYVQLRANRRDPTLPDSHGQIWAELAALSEMDGSLFHGMANAVGQRMLETLGLSERVKFPIRRLVTLWKNIQWQPMITKWCRTDLGRATFNISTWEAMARCRIDDFWFDTFDEILATMSRLTGGTPEVVQLGDWMTLAQLPFFRSREDIQKVFYPGEAGNKTGRMSGSETESEAWNAPSSRRRGDFLTALNDQQYQEACHLISITPELSFPNIHAFLKASKHRGRVMMQVISHVGQWLSCRPIQVVDREGNKPPLRRDFLPALRERYSDQAEAQSIVLQRNILAFVGEHMDDFTNPTVEVYLQQLPDDTGQAYSERFAHQVWRDLLVTVYGVVGPHFQGSVVRQFNDQNPEALAVVPASAITQAMCDVIRRVAETARNPVLNDPSALEALHAKIHPIVMEWAAQQCEEALQAQKSQPWSPRALQLVVREREKFKMLADAAYEPAPPPDASASPLRLLEFTQGNTGGAFVGAQLCIGMHEGTSGSTNSSPGPVEVTEEEINVLRKNHYQSHVGTPRAEASTSIDHCNGPESNEHHSSHLQPQRTHPSHIRARSSWRQSPAARAP